MAGDKVATAIIEFVTEGAKYFKGVDDIEARAKGLKGAFSSLSKEMLSAFALPVTAAGVVGLLGTLGAKALQNADAIDKMSKATGSSAEQIQRLKSVSATSSVAVESLADSSYKMGLRVAQGNKDAAAGAKALGLEFEALKRASPDERMNIVMHALEGVEDATERNRIGTLLYGKAFKDIAPAVDGYTAALGQASVASNEQIAALARAGDAIDLFMAKLSNASTMMMGFLAETALALGNFGKKAADVSSLSAEELKKYHEIIDNWGDGQAFLIKVENDRAVAAQKAASGQKVATAATAAYTEQLKLAQAEIKGISAAEKAQGDAASKLGKSQEEVAAAYGISEEALKIYTAQIRANAAEVKKAAKEGTIWGDGLSALQQLQVKFNIQLDETDHGAAAAAEGMAEVADAIARTTGEVINFGPPTEQMLKQLDKLQAAGTISPSQGLLGAPIDTTLPPPPSKFSGWTSAVNDWAGQLPAQIARAFEGGGGWAGAIQAGASTLGSGLMGKIFGSMGKDGKAVGGLANGMSGFFATAITAAAPIIGAVAGPLIGKILGHFNKPEFKKIANDVGKQWGVSISDGLAQQIEKDAKEKFGKDRVAGELFNLDAIIGEAGGLDTSNLDKFTGKLRDVFVMIGQGKFKAADAAKVLDANWSAFVAAHTDGNGRVSKSLKEIIALADQFGVKSKEIAAWQKGQGSAAIEGFNAVVQAAAGTTRRELQNLETQALASYNAAVKAGTGEAEALAAIGPSLDAIRAKWKELGLESDNAAFQALDAQRAMLSANPALAAGVDGLKQQMVALANLNALDATTFAAMGETAALMYTRLQAEAEKLGKTGAEGTEAALRPMQQYLQLAAAQAKELGIPLDENTQELIRQSQELGIWKEVGLTAAEKNTAALERTASALEKVAAAMGLVIDQAKGNPFAGWVPPGGVPGLPEPGGPNSTLPVVPAAEGFDGWVRRPTMFLTAERGPEHVKVSPNGPDRGGGGGAPVNVTMPVSIQVQGSIVTEREMALTVVERFNDGGEVYQAMERLIQTVSPRLRPA